MAQRFLVGPGYDLAFVLGGAPFTLAIAALCATAPATLPWVLWGWIVLFEGSHFWATFSRTYADRAYRRANASLLFGSAIFFALPGLALLHRARSGNDLALEAYGFGLFVWSLYHNARQHYGFVSIYARKAGLDERARTITTVALYVAVCAPQAYFLLGYKIPSSSLALGALAIDPGPWTWAAISTAAALLAVVAAAAQAKRRDALLPAAYVAVCAVFYATMFFVVAPREPYFQGAGGGARRFMLIAVMNSLFHNIQYHAIVRYYGRRRGDDAAAREGLGLGAIVHRGLYSYAAAALLLGLVFGAIVWNLGDWPSPLGGESARFHPVAWWLFTGIIGHHFYLDQKIWRPTRQPELRAYLALPA